MVVARGGLELRRLQPAPATAAGRARAPGVGLCRGPRGDRRATAGRAGGATGLHVRPGMLVLQPRGPPPGLRSRPSARPPGPGRVSPRTRWHPPERRPPAATAPDLWTEPAPCAARRRAPGQPPTRWSRSRYCWGGVDFLSNDPEDAAI